MISSSGSFSGTHSRNLLLTVMGLAVVLYFSGLGLAPVYILDEAKNAQCAKEMMLRGDWIVPTFNDILRTDKPPLHYFFMRLGYWIFGVNPLGARFFSAFFGVGTVTVLFLFTRKYLGELVAFLSALVFLSSINLSLEMHFAVPDPYLIFFLSSAMFFIFHFMESGVKPYLYLFYLLIGLAVLTKGPVAVGLPGLIILIFLIWNKSFSWKKIISFQPWWGALIILAIAGPWYWNVHLQTDGAWTRGFFLDHNINRFAKVKEGHGGFFGLTIIFVILGILPFSVFLIQSLVKGFKDRKNTFIQYSWIIAIAFIIFFTISSTKLPNYTMPCYPFLSVLIGYFLAVLLKGEGKGVKASLWVLFVMMLALPIGLWFAIRMEPQIKDLEHWAYLFILLPVAAGMALHHYYKGRVIQMIFSLSLGFMLISIFFFGFVYPEVYRRNPAYQHLQSLPNGTTLVAYKDYNPSYNFYRESSIPVITSPIQLDSLLNAGKKVTIISRVKPEERKDLEEKGWKMSYSGKDIFEETTSVAFEH